MSNQIRALKRRGTDWSKKTRAVSWPITWYTPRTPDIPPVYLTALHQGLGKTLTALSFLDTVLRHARQYHALQSREHYNVLVIVPANALHHWYAEWDRWFGATCQYKCACTVLPALPRC